MLAPLGHRPICGQAGAGSTHACLNRWPAALGGAVASALLQFRRKGAATRPVPARPWLRPRPAAVGARPLKDPVLELPVFDIMATAFQPLPNPNPRGLEPAPGTEDADAPASPAAAPAVSTVSLNPRVWSEPLRVDILHR